MGKGSTSPRLEVRHVPNALLEHTPLQGVPHRRILVKIALKMLIPSQAAMIALAMQGIPEPEKRARRAFQANSRLMLVQGLVWIVGREIIRPKPGPSSAMIARQVRMPKLAPANVFAMQDIQDPMSHARPALLERTRRHLDRPFASIVKQANIQQIQLQLLAKNAVKTPSAQKEVLNASARVDSAVRRSPAPPAMLASTSRLLAVRLVATVPRALTLR